MATEIAPLRLGTRICFEDRWQGRLAGFDLSEEFEVLNIIVETGFLVSRNSVKLPFTTVTRFEEGAVYLNVISFHAFRREFPPIATPAQPLSAKTPIAHPGARLAGLLVRKTDHRASDFLIELRGRLHRASREQVTFDGGTITLAQQLTALPLFVDDDVLVQRIHDTLGNDEVMPIDDKRTLDISVDRGSVGRADLAHARHVVRLADRGSPPADVLVRRHRLPRRYTRRACAFGSGALC